MELKKSKKFLFSILSFTFKESFLRPRRGQKNYLFFIRRRFYFIDCFRKISAMQKVNVDVMGKLEPGVTVEGLQSNYPDWNIPVMDELVELVHLTR